jgi:membrane protein required for colicin V production
LSKVDIAIALILALGGFLGYKKGFLMELVFLIAIVLGVFIGFRLIGAGVSFLHKQLNADTYFLPYLSFLIIFIIVVVLVILLGRSIKGSVDRTFLGKMDDIAGAVLGVIKYAFCISIVFWLATSLHYSFPVQWTKGSVLYPMTVKLAPALAAFSGRFIPFFKEIFHQF